MGSRKPWLSFKDQAELLQARGLHISDFEAALHARIFPLISQIEILVRTSFAYQYSSLVGPIALFTKKHSRVEPVTSKEHPNLLAAGSAKLKTNSDLPPCVRSALSDVKRSKEGFIECKIPEDLTTNSAAEMFRKVPVWAAVEVMTFGTTSRLLVAAVPCKVYDAVAKDLDISPKLLHSQVHSLVYLRDRIFHHSRLWNHGVLVKPALPRNPEPLLRRIDPTVNNSVFRILIAMDNIARRNHIADNWLEDEIMPLLNQNPLLRAGIITPKQFGQMPHELLIREPKTHDPLI